MGETPQNYSAEGEEKLGYLLVPRSHWLTFLTGNINSSALLVYPSPSANSKRKPSGRGSQMFEWELFNESIDNLQEG